MSGSRHLQLLRAAKRFFDTSTACLDEADSGFTPSGSTFNVAQHVAHVAQTVDWFVEGAFGDGFRMDVEALEKEVRKVESLSEARAWLDRAFDNARRIVRSKSAAELSEPFPARSPIMAGSPRHGIVDGIADHTAHHRGALTVYARLRGKVPGMPYA